MSLLVFCSVAGVAERFLALVAVLAGERFLPGVTPLVDLQVLQPGEAPSAVWLATLERPLSCVNSQVGHQLVLSIERLGVTGTVLWLIVSSGPGYSAVLTLQ